MSRKERRRLKTHQARSQKREKRRTDVLSGGGQPSRRPPRASFDPLCSVPTNQTFDVPKVALTGYVGLQGRKETPPAPTLKELLATENFQYIAWDGRTPTPLTYHGRVIGILAGRLRDEQWEGVVREASTALNQHRPHCRPTAIPTPLNPVPRRGDFIALNCGVSFGGGQKKPGNLINNAANALILDMLNSMACFQRIAGFANSVFSRWAPKLYEYYRSRTESLHLNNPDLRRNFPRSVFSAATYNFGPQTVCREHTDFNNLAFGWCSVTSLGEFDHRSGGHLVLWECGLIIEFPAGSTILFPSAAIAHSNTPISQGETRSSFTQYSAGGLFRWVEQQFQTSKQYCASLNPSELAAVKSQNKSRWDNGLSMYSTLEGLGVLRPM